MAITSAAFPRCSRAGRCPCSGPRARRSRDARRRFPAGTGSSCRGSTPSSTSSTCPAIRPDTSPISASSAGRRCSSAAIRCSPAAAAACSKARPARCGRRCRRSPPCRPRRASIAGTNTRWRTFASPSLSNRAARSSTRATGASRRSAIAENPRCRRPLRVERATNPFLRAHLPGVRAAAAAHAGHALADDVASFAALREWKNTF